MLHKICYTKIVEICSWVKYLFGLLVLFFQDIKLVIWGVILLIVIDQFTGVWKALKLREFTWKVFNNLYTKLILYLLCIIASYILEKMVLESQSYYFTKGVAGVIGVQEVVSVYTNASVITGKSYLRDYVLKVFKKVK